MIAWDTLLLAPVEGIFGQPATYRARDGTQFPLNGVFDEAVTDVDVSASPPVTTVRPVYGYRVAALPVKAHQGDTLFIRSAPGAPAVDTRYVVREVRVDGHGWGLLLLNIAPQD
ncbi:head-tail joining protein [Paraburkholderia adhaesiva]|uniref:head-tail joining protein n=1 Tax=Paraburkholderia adhaesiva TaxID=2883244 RepID=UPI001F16BFA1|nr:hypothetical protein [Paraburkholderia adhaesiva]